MGFKLDNFGTEVANAKGTLGGICYYRYRNDEGDDLETAGYFPALLGLNVGDRIFVIPQDASNADELYVVTSIANRTVEVEKVSTGGGSAVIDELNVTPSTSAQTITPSEGVDGFAPVNVAAVDNTIDENITAANIVSGVTILGVSGSATVLDGETVSVTPTTSAQTITPTAPKNGITEVSVAAVTATIDANIIAGNIKDGVTILGVTGDYTGGGSTGKYSLLQRVTDDSNQEIGTVCGFHRDANNVEYAIVALDAPYRQDYYQLTEQTSVAGLTAYSDSSVYGSKETATANCNLILAASTVGSVCEIRAKPAFTIDGVQYERQVPTLSELIKLLSLMTEINAADTSSGSGLALSTSWIYLSCSAASSNYWGVSTNGRTSTITLGASASNLTATILELPNA